MPRRKKTAQEYEKDATRPISKQEPKRYSRSQQPAKFSNYIFKVLKQVHPQLSMTNKAMKVMDDFMHDIYSRLVTEAAGLVKFTKKSTLSAAEFQTATRLILPGELAKHAINDGTKAVATFMRSKSEDARTAKAYRDKTAETSSMNIENAREPTVEIEIFRTAPRPILNGSSEIRTGESDIEECLEDEGLVTDVAVSKSNNLRRKELNGSYGNIGRAEIQNSSVSNSEISTTEMVSTLHSPTGLAADGKTSARSSSAPPDGIMEIDLISDTDTVELTEENLSDNRMVLSENAGRPTPSTEGESDNSNILSTRSETTPTQESPSEPAQNQVQGEKSLEMEVDEVESQCTSSGNVSSFPLAPEDNPASPNAVKLTEVPNDDSFDLDKSSPDNSERMQQSQVSLDSGLEGSAERDGNLSHVSINETPSGSADCGANVNEETSCETRTETSVETSVTVRCTKMVTSKSTIIHERREQISEWFSQTKGFH